MKQIDFSPEELTTASQWHDGQSSMLYAISSTGSLRTGTEACRPFACDDCSRGWIGFEPCRCGGRKMTDAQWLAYLASKLEKAESAAEDAREREREPNMNDKDADEMGAIALDEIARKYRAAILVLAILVLGA